MKEDYLDIEYASPNVTTEAFFGKRPEFERAEIIVEQIRKIILSHKAEGSISNTKENKALEEIFRKVFGFKKVHILWIDAVIPNAYTIVSSFVHRGSAESKFIVKDKSKGYYNTGNDDILFVAVYTGLLGETNLTSEEFLGVVLHEIGHNFDYSAYNTICGVLRRVMYNIKPSWKEEYNKYMLNKEDFKSRHNNTEDVYKEYLDLREKLRITCKRNEGLARMIGFPITLVMIPISILFSVINIPFTLASKKSENFADSFAAAYGYAAGCMSGLEKLSAYPKTLKNSSNFTKLMVDISSCWYEFSSYLMECHGTHQERIALTIKKLERDLKSGDYPEDMKKDLEKELDTLKALYHKITTYNKEEMNYVSITFRKIIDFLFKGTNIFYQLFPRNQA